MGSDHAILLTISPVSDKINRRYGLSIWNIGNNRPLCRLGCTDLSRSVAGKQLGRVDMTGDRAMPAKFGRAYWTTVKQAFSRLTLPVMLLTFVAVLSGFTIKDVRVEKSYYKITGKSHGELVKAVKRNGPRAGRAYGLGIIDFFPSYRMERSDGKCRIADAEVGLRIKLRLPKWQEQTGVPRSVVRIAKRFERVIDAHEMQHVRIAKQYQRLMRQRLRKLSPDQSCWELRKRAREMIAQLKRRHIQAHKRFDNRTRKQIRRLL